MPSSENAQAVRSPLPATSATTLRFILLAVAATAAVISVANWLLPAVFGEYSRAHENAVFDCRNAVYQDVINIARSNDSWNVLRSLGPVNERIGQLTDCGSTDRSWIWTLTGVVSFWATVLAVLRWLPSWRIRRRRYEHLGRVTADQLSVSAAEPAHLIGSLVRLQRRAEVRTAVNYLRDNLDPRCTALAFGRFGQRYIVLSAGLETLRHRDPAAFDAVVLHELAHVQNRDIDIGFLTVIAWRIAMPLVGVTILLMIGSTLESLRGPAMYTLAVGTAPLKFLVLAATVLLLRNSVLRGRELYADARVSQWASREDVASMLEKYFPDKPRRLKPFWTHPSPTQRNEALLDNRILTATPVWVWFAVGLLTEILTWNIALSHDNPGVLADYLPAAVFVAASYGIEISRNPHSAQRFSAGRPVAIGLALGVATGLVLFEPGTVLLVLQTSDAFAFQYLLWIPLLCGAAWLAYRWLGVVVAAWSPVLATPRTSLSKALSGLAAGLAIVPILVGLAFLLTLPVQSVAMPLVNAKGLLAALAILAELPLRFVLSPYYYSGPLLLITTSLPLVADSIVRRRQTAPRRRERSSLARAMLTGLWVGLLSAPLTVVAEGVLPSLGGNRTASVFVLYGIIVLAQMACAALLGYRLAYRPHPISAAAVGALTVGFLYAAISLALVAALSTLSTGTAVAEEGVLGLIQAAWYPVPVGVILGVGIARATQALRLRRPDVDTTTEITVHRQDPIAGLKPYLRRGLRYGAISALATGFVTVCVSVYFGILVVPAIQVACAARVVSRSPHPTRPVWAATLASFTAAVVGQLAMPLLMGVMVASKRLQFSGGLVVAGVFLTVCPIVVGTGIAAAVAGIVHSARRDRGASRSLSG